MTALLDNSVVVKWFYADRESSEVEEARAILEAVIYGTLAARVLDLTYLELGNTAARNRRVGTADVVAVLTGLHSACGEGIRLRRALYPEVARLAAQHHLSFYDAAYWAVADELGLDLVTADGELIAAGAGEAPSIFAARLGLP